MRVSMSIPIPQPEYRSPYAGIVQMADNRD
jgi:hypothetical protein